MKRVVQTAAVWAVLCQLAGAQIIIQHRGTNNPTTEGFLSDGSGPGISAFPTNDGGTLAWNILDTDTANQREYYAFLHPTNIARLATQWRVGWQVKAINAPDPNSFAMLFNPSNSTGNRVRYQLEFQRTNATDMRVALAGGGPTLLIAGAGEGFHIYDLIRTNSATDVAQFYFDGVFQTNYSGFLDSTETIGWGSLDRPKVSFTEWGFVFVEVPEPSSLLFVAAATTLGIIFRRRKLQR